MYGEKTIATIKETIAVLHAAGKRVGLSVGASDEKSLRFWNSLDFDFISTGSDAGFIFSGAKDTLARIRTIQAGK
jgi:2-keto-3-deoxy-L-rhamnonate aldolase RhmA